MKPYILFLIFIVLLAAYLKTLPTKNIPAIPSPAPTSFQPTSTPSPAHQITFKDHLFQYYYRRISSTDSFKLIPNFSDTHQTSTQIIQSGHCDFGINGGFYRADNKPLGFFYLNQKQLGNQTGNSTFDGLLLSQNNHLQVDSINNLPKNLADYNFIFQTGPLFNLSSPTSSFIDQDYARRHMIAVDSKNNLYLFSIFELDSAYSGPRLQDIPDIFKSNELKKISQFTAVLNLDGGSASAFFDSSTNTKVEELSPIGSFLCGQTNQY